MYSNFITPPDFVNDSFHTVTVIDASISDVEILGKMCQGIDDSFNIYLYREEMHNLEWLDKAVSISDAIIVNTDAGNYNQKYCLTDKTYYYGSKTLASTANKVDTVFRYFAIRYHQQNK
jgi:hypothetical protein